MMKRDDIYSLLGRLGPPLSREKPEMIRTARYLSAERRNFKA
jgi:hypothetical protein